MTDHSRPWHRRLLLPLLLLLGLVLTACGPEGNRTRGGGAGADVGNRDDSVQLQEHEQRRDTRIFHDTPDDQPDAKAAT